MIISIDIGTSYSSVCLLTAEGKTEPVETTTGISIYGGKYSLPSAVFVDENGEVLVGQAAMNSRKKMPQNFRSEFKRDLGQDIPIMLGGRNFLPEDLYTELFRHMKGCAEKQGMEDVEKAYITYPASFGKTKRERITQAARKAGLFDIELVDEPTAAAMCYGEKGKIQDGDILLVYDFGGGTFDAALLKYEAGKYESLTSAEGVEHCGGIDIDRMIYSDIHARIAPRLLQPLAANKPNRLRFEGQLAEMAVKIKHHLSAAEYAYEDIAVGFDAMEYRLSCEELEKMSVGLVSQTIDCCRSILGSAGITVSKLDGILMVGGMSRMPLVQRMVREFAGNTVVHTDVDPDLAVVQGALSLGLKNPNVQCQVENNYFYRVKAGQSYEEAVTYEPCGLDVKEVVKGWQKAAEQGDAAAQYNLGACYAKGLGVEQSYEEAVKWYRKAAEQGDAVAQYNLGVCYAKGQGVKQNYEEAVKGWQKAAEQGYAAAQFNMGISYMHGYGVEQSYEEGVKWYWKAAEQGHIAAQFNLGSCYVNGHGVEQSYEEGVKWYWKAAEQGNADAQSTLGFCYDKGYGVEQSYEEAVKWYRRAGEQGHAEGQYNLGVCYFNGYGVKQSYEEGIKWYWKAAEQEHTVAQFSLGNCYMNGIGVEQNCEEAVKWYQKAANQGGAEAQCALGTCYLNGYGVEQSYEDALKWYQKAANQSYERANYYIRVCLHIMNAKGLIRYI